MFRNNNTRYLYEALKAIEDANKILKLDPEFLPRPLIYPFLPFPLGVILSKYAEWKRKKYIEKELLIKTIERQKQLIDLLNKSSLTEEKLKYINSLLERLKEAENRLKN